MGTKDIVYCCETAADLIEYLKTFPAETKVCGVGGGEITVTQQSNYPDRLWFE